MNKKKPNPTTVRLPILLKTRIDKYRKKTGHGLTYIIIRALEDYLDAHSPIRQNKKKG